MAKLSRSELEEIIKRERPGYRIVSPETDDDAAPVSRSTAPDAVSPSAAALRRKYGTTMPEADAAPHAHEDEDEDEDDEDAQSDDDDEAIVSIAPDIAGADPWDTAHRATSAIVTRRGVIGEQG